MRRSRRLLAALERSGLAAKTTVVVLADHGFRTARRTINPNVALRNAGLIRGEGAAGGPSALDDAVGWRRRHLPHRPERSGRRWCRRSRRRWQGIEGVERSRREQRLAALGLPDPATSDQAPDVVVAARDGYDFGRADTGALVVDTDATHVGHHGALNTDPSMRALFLAWGRDIKPGGAAGDVRAIDVAPTIAEWLGVQLPSAGWHVAGAAALAARWRAAA